MRVGDRVFVETSEFKGTATIFYLAPFDIYSIQVELDEADNDGHKMKRVSIDQIKQEPKITSTKSPPNKKEATSITEEARNLKEPTPQRQMSFFDLI